MARRSASARPSDGSDFMMSNVDVVSRMAAFESTAQCVSVQHTDLCQIGRNLQSAQPTLCLAAKFG
jgi:hypothetical protein